MVSQEAGGVLAQQSVAGFFVPCSMKHKKLPETVGTKATALDSLEQRVTEAKKANWRIAEEKVIAYEASKGWLARKVNDEYGYDILSVKGDQERHIEVKSKLGTGKKFGWTVLTVNETKKFQEDDNYFVYLVEGESVEKDAPFFVVELHKSELENDTQTLLRLNRLGSRKRKQIG